MKLICLIIGWIIIVLLITIFNYGAHHDYNDETEPDETSHRGRYKYTHSANDDENVIF